MGIEDLAEVLEADLPRDAGRTLGGFLMNTLGKVPVVGERVVAGGYEFRIVRMLGHRIKRVDIRRVTETTNSPSSSMES